MSLPILAVGYIAIGAVSSLVIACVRRRVTTGDLLLIVVLWPLYVPLSFSRTTDDQRETELLSALARAQDSPLASVLPDAETARVLGSRLREAEKRFGELDTILARPDFDPKAVEIRATTLAARGATAAAATAQLRVRTLGQLRALRERYRRELDEVSELIAQLVTQAELVRLQPSMAHASSELVQELVNRVDSLGDLFTYQAALESGELPEYGSAPERLA